ncbi:MAG: hypothetical protein SNJ57_07490, partial [Cyanobacteriota bacterium]
RVLFEALVDLLNQPHRVNPPCHNPTVVNTCTLISDALMRQKYNTSMPKTAECGVKKSKKRAAGGRPSGELGVRKQELENRTLDNKLDNKVGRSDAADLGVV